MKIRNYAVALKICLFILLLNVYYCPHAQYKSIKRFLDLTLLQSSLKSVKVKNISHLLVLHL